MKSILHRSSLRLIRTAISIASSGVGSNKHAPALSSCASGIDTCSSRNLFDVEHADDVVLLSKDPS